MTGDYFDTMQIPVLSGRGPDSRDEVDGRQVGAINATMAATLWPDGDAIGKRIRNSIDDTEWVTIVGVVGDVKHNGLTRTADLMLYRPFSQSPDWVRDLSLVVRSDGDPVALATPVREAIRQVDPRVPTPRIITLDRVVTTSIANTRLTAWLINLFGIQAALLAAIGVFGVLSASVNQRRAEMGIRLSLGARPSDLLRLVIQEGMRPALAGAAVGVLLALGLTRLLASLLFGVGPADPLTFVLAVVLLGLVALIACYLPARRAAGVEPMEILRSS